MDSNDIHREVSNHVLNTIPVKPLRYETLNWPLGFLQIDANEVKRISQTGKSQSLKKS